MSDVLPNLSALLDHLGGTTAARRDAQTLAQAVRDASTVEEIDEQLAAVAADWREQ